MENLPIILWLRPKPYPCNDIMQTFRCKVNRNEWFFFLVHGEWIVARNKQIVWTAKRFSSDWFVPRYDSLPIDQEQKTLIPYINNVSTKDSF